MVLFFQFLSVFSRDTDCFFISTYLSFVNNLILQAKLGQLAIHRFSIPPPQASFDISKRQWGIPASGNCDNFTALAKALIPNFIPTLYLEGYIKLITLVAQLPWPKFPKCIFTSNSYSADDVFKAWAASKVESNSKLIIGQHGGNFGVSLWGFTEDHQVAIADRFLSWGWTTPNINSIVPFGNFKDFHRKICPNKNGYALLVENSSSRYSYHMMSVPVSQGQFLEYLDDQFNFIEALPTYLRDQVVVRLYSQDYGISLKQRWHDSFPHINLDEGLLPLPILLRKCRLYVSTYNATTYLESLALNFPTIIFWNPMHWELRESAVPFFESLKSVGIFHETPESAAQQMAMVWNDISGWWDSAEVQSIRLEFCKRYSHFPDSPLDNLASLFKHILASDV